MPPDLPRGMHLQCLQHPYLWQLLLRTQSYDSKLSDNLDSNEHFFYFRNSPFPKDQLLLSGNDKLKVLTSSEEMLNRMDCNFPFMMLLLPEIKIHLARRVPIDPDMSYHDLWEKAILEDQDDFRNIVKVKDCSFYPSPHI